MFYCILPQEGIPSGGCVVSCEKDLIMDQKIIRLGAISIDKNAAIRCDTLILFIQMCEFKAQHITRTRSSLKFDSRANSHASKNIATE